MKIVLDCISAGHISIHSHQTRFFQGLYSGKCHQCSFPPSREQHQCIIIVSLSDVHPFLNLIGDMSFGWRLNSNGPPISRYKTSAIDVKTVTKTWCKKLLCLFITFTRQLSFRPSVLPTVSRGLSLFFFSIFHFLWPQVNLSLFQSICPLIGVWKTRSRNLRWFFTTIKFWLFCNLGRISNVSIPGNKMELNFIVS